jgi:hypothetical protein
MSSNKKTWNYEETGFLISFTLTGFFICPLAPLTPKVLSLRLNKRSENGKNYHLIWNPIK